MGQVGALIADAGTVGLRYAKRILESVPEQRFGRLAAPGGETIPSNHPAFVVGHLTLYPQKVLELLGQNDAAARPPADYQSLFSKDAACVDDADGSKYPRKEELLGVFQRTYDAAVAALRACDDALLLGPNPADTPMKTLCPTLGSMLAFYMTGHVTMHMGQVSAWRRMEGLPPA
ncbi:MAG: DinB family protein [Aureliella sp.]